MTKTTTVRDADGRVVSSTTTQGGCGSGCGWLLTALLILFVVVVPAESFPLWGAILAYLVEAIIALAVGVQWIQKRRGSRAQ
ncbi:MAG: hypothetical protein ACREN1_02640 [Candidatus Dormibacteria bacterium]